jgi:hypothetical protein
MHAMSAAPSFCRLVLGDSVAVVAATDAADAAPPPSGRVDEIAGAWRTCQPELERRRGTLTWEDTPSREPSLAAALAALGDLERGAVAAQALGLEPGEVEQALGTDPGAAPGLLARAHVRLAGLGRPAGAACAEERERLASAPAGTSTEHCADCRTFAAAVSEQRLALRRAAGGQDAAPTARQDEKPPAASAFGQVRSAPSPVARPAAGASVVGRARSAAAAARRSGAAASVVERVRSAASTARRSDAVTSVVARVRSAASTAWRSETATSAVARTRSAASAAAVVVGPILEPKERGPRIAVALAVLLLAGLAGFGVVSAFETPREGGGDSDVVTATPVGPLPPGVGPKKP